MSRRRRSPGAVLVVALSALASCAREPLPESQGGGFRGAGAPPETAFAPSTAGVQRGLATYYAARFTGLRTANGERYDPRQMTAAHRSLPFGTWVEVRRSQGPPNQSVVVRINDRGPYGRDRIVDLSHRAAEQLGILSEGKAAVELRVVAPPSSLPR